MKKIILLFLFLTSVFAQTDTLSYTAAEIDSALARSLVNYNKSIWFTSEGNTNNTGLNINNAKATLQQALDKGFALVPSTSNRIAVIGLEYANDATDYTIPDYISVFIPHSTYSGSITLGTGSQFFDASDFDISGKVNYSDSLTTFVTPTQLADSAFLKAADITAKVNYSDSLTTFTTPTQIADSVFLQAADITGKVNYSDSLTTFTTPNQIADSLFLQAADITGKVNYSDSLTTFTTPNQIADSLFLQASDISGKVNYSDSLTTFTTPNQIADSVFLQAADIVGKVNYSDSLTTFTTPNQIADSLFLQAADIAGKVNYSDSLTTFTTPTQIADSVFLQASDITGKVNYSDSLTTFVTPDQLEDSLTFGTWKVFYTNATGKLIELALGTDGQVLTSTGAGTIPAFETPSGGFADPMTTRGDIIYRDATNTTNRLAVGSANYVLTSDGTDVSWAASSGGSALLDTVIYKSANETVTSSTTLQDDDDFAGISLTASKDYYFKMVLFYRRTDRAALKWQFTSDINNTGYYYTQRSPSFATETSDTYGVRDETNYQNNNSSGFDSNVMRCQSFDSFIVAQATIEGVIEAPGSNMVLDMKWAQNAADANGTTIMQGSSLQIREIP